MMFENREQAARLLAGRLHHLRGKNPLVLGIPRGGIPMARIIADSLGGDLDVILVRKLGFPNNPEVAIGAVDEAGTMYLNDHLPDYGISDEYIERERERELLVMQSRRELYTPVRPNVNPKGRTVIVVDDGVATGFTMATALRSVRKAEPRYVVAALAVAPPDALKQLQESADEVCSLHVTQEFIAVGQFFSDFSQVSDEDVMRMLSEQPMHR